MAPPSAGWRAVPLSGSQSPAASSPPSSSPGHRCQPCGERLRHGKVLGRLERHSPDAHASFKLLYMYYRHHINISSYTEIRHYLILYIIVRWCFLTCCLMLSKCRVVQPACDLPAAKMLSSSMAFSSAARRFSRSSMLLAGASPTCLGRESFGLKP